MLVKQLTIESIGAKICTKIFRPIIIMGETFANNSSSNSKTMSNFGLQSAQIIEKSQKLNIIIQTKKKKTKKKNDKRNQSKD